GHDLDRVLPGLDVGKRPELAVDLVLERREVDAACLLQPLELVEEDFGVLELGGAARAGRAAEGEPGALDALAQAAAAALRPGGAEHVAHARDARLAVGREAG